METENDSLRAEADGYNMEDGDCVHEAALANSIVDEDVSTVYIDHGHDYTKYLTPLHALSNGWRLMAPPFHYTWTDIDGKFVNSYVWWFEK